MPYPKDIEAEVTFLPTQAGGRHTPVLSGYRSQFYYDGLDWDAVQFYPDVDQVNPGDTARAYLTFLRPEAHAGKIKSGTLFLIREGHRTVGYGQVIRLMDLEESARRAREREQPRQIEQKQDQQEE